MRKRKQPSSKASARQRSSVNLDSLSQQFQLFRSSHPRITRIPEPLRKAVVAALEGGASKSSVQKACGVSWVQMKQWKTEYAKGARAPRRRRTSMVTTELTGAGRLVPKLQQPTPPPRVLSVVDEEPTGQDGDPHRVPLLELRVSGWSIRLHPTDD